ncbi:hypothetical protein EVAR_75085_1 [Eumeta japonica]|uniref:Uncharacterized protein n=1 Tax=Eumeta variegata TaxID=151549 RepID=A0A4C1W016_EUMVA|nr:hypothetical protein EVAR_75085_1 [Eumeta japonica]
MEATALLNGQELGDNTAMSPLVSNCHCTTSSRSIRKSEQLKEKTHSAQSVVQNRRRPPKKANATPGAAERRAAADGGRPLSPRIDILRPNRRKSGNNRLSIDSTLSIIQYVPPVNRWQLVGNGMAQLWNDLPSVNFLYSVSSIQPISQVLPMNYCKRFSRKEPISFQQADNALVTSPGL